MSEGWIDLAEHVAETLDIGPGTRVFEVDCGDGAFLFPFHQNGFIVGGIDADPEAIKKAIAAMPDGIFQLGMATALDPAVPWDVVICRLSRPFDKLRVVPSGVEGRAESRESLSGLPETDYVRGVVARMFAKATHAIALLGVPDARRQWLLHALAEIGAQAIQFEEVKTAAGAGAVDTFNAFARV